MNKNRKEELVTRWMDGALSDEELREIEPILAEHPEMHQAREEYVQVRRDLKAMIPAEVDPPYPDFFNTHLERHIEGLARGESVEPTERRAGLGWLWTWWMAPVATAALVVAFVAGMNSTSSDVPAPLAEATAAYSPLENVTAEAVQDESLDATVIVLSGLDEIDDENLMGWNGPASDDSGFYISIANIY